MLTKFETKSARVKGKISLAVGNTGAIVSESTTTTKFKIYILHLYNYYYFSKRCVIKSF